MVLMLAAVLASGFAALGQTPAVLTAMRAAPAPDGLTITLQLSAPAVPRPAEMIENPLRLFLDLPNVSPGRQRVLNGAGGGVIQVRAALNQPSPPVTRVVIELESRMEWDVTPGAKPNEIQIRLRRPNAAPAAIDRRQQLVTNMRGLTSAVEAMRAWTGPSDQELAALLQSLEEMSTAARAMQGSGQPPDLLLVAAVDGVMNAARARAQALADNQPQSRANAIAAANGALLLLGQVR